MLYWAFLVLKLKHGGFKTAKNLYCWKKSLLKNICDVFVALGRSQRLFQANYIMATSSSTHKPLSSAYLFRFTLRHRF